MNGDGPSDKQTDPSAQLQPGQTISPGSAASSGTAVSPPAPPTETPSENPPAAGQPAGSEPENLPDEPESADEPDDTSAPTPPSAQDATGPISWTASEFIAHDKSIGWYGALAGVAIVVAALVFILTRDKISTAVVIVAALAFGFYAARRPAQQQYVLDDQGLHIGQRYYDYGEFRSFSIVDEGSFSSISFLPLKRFSQLISIYYAPEDEAAIVELLSARLPLENRGHDAFDRFLKRIRF